MPFSWRSHQKRVGKFAQLFGQVWENLGNNPLHAQKFPCSYTYASQLRVENEQQRRQGEPSSDSTATANCIDFSMVTNF